MNRILFTCFSIGMVAGVATHASAQVAGTYSGAAADGSPISFAVSTDPNTNVLAVTSASIDFTAVCKKSATTLSSGWGYGLTADITGGKASNESAYNYFDIAFTIDFAKDGQSANGTVSVISPDLSYPNNSPPASAALFCTSKKQKFALSLQAGAIGPHLPPHYVVMLPPR